MRRRGRRALQDLESDLRQHIELEIDENIARGLSPGEARRHALLKLGNPTSISEDTRDVWAWRWLEDLRRDLTYAWRSLRRAPAFGAASVLTLGLGVGALTVMTSIAYGVLYRPLPFANADRLVRIVQLIGQNGDDSRTGLRPEQIASWQAHGRTFAVGYYQSMSRTLTGVPAPVRLTGAGVTPALFRGIAVPPLAGRLFTDEDALPGNTHVVLFPERTWRREFGGDPALVDRTVTLNNEAYRVIGIMPAPFEFPSVAAPSTTDSTGALADAPEFWAPLPALEEQPIRAGGGFTVYGNTFGLLNPGVTLAQATAEANTLLPLQPDRPVPIELVNARVEQARTVKPLLLMFEAAVAFVLFIACANVTNLLLARSAARRRELAVRLSLGAGRLRLFRQAIAEGLLIGVLGAGVGAVLTWAGLAVFRQLPPYLMPRMSEVRIGGSTVAFATFVAVLAGAIVSAAAADRGSRDATIAGHTAARSTTLRKAPLRALVIAQVASGIVLFTGAALLLSSLARLTRIDPGFDSARVFSFQLTLPAGRYETGSAALFAQRLASELEGLRGVSAVSVGDSPLGYDSIGFSPGVDGQTLKGSLAFRTVPPGFFETLGIATRGGRTFVQGDAAGSVEIAIVNEAFVGKYLPGVNPIGHRVSLQNWKDLAIVGVVSDTRAGRPDAHVGPQLYVPVNSAASGSRSLTFFLRSASKADPALGREIRALVGQIDPDLVVFNDATLETRLARTYADARTYGVSSMTFAAIALVLAAIGLYGVLAFTVGARTREIGVRIAVGADRGRLLWMVLSDALATVIAGIALGLGAAWYVSRFLQKWLYGVTPHDPIIFAGVALVFLIVGTLATYIPARRATRVDPVAALRAD